MRASCPLDRLEVYNFKSYRGRQTIGPFKAFTAIIGPNGAGKSNLMDAISFVLGVRSSSLRSSALKDLIYRSGKKGKGKGKAVEGVEGDDDDEDDEEDDEEEDGGGVDEDEEEEGDRDGERKAWVMAVYVDDEDKEWKFQRSISTAGTSDYKIDNKSVTYKKYNDKLEGFNILVKAKNFLVFQGDVEAVASQSPKDLAKLIDQISGSLDLKEEYDAASLALEKATETSINQHSRRKGVNGEIKQYKEMKKEAERWKSLGDQKNAAIIQHLLWKLYHIEQGIKSNTEEIISKNEKLIEIRSEHNQFEEAQRSAKKEVTKAQKDVVKQEKSVKKLEKDLEDARPGVVAIDAKLTHAAKKLKGAEENAKKIESELVDAQKDLTKHTKELADVKKALDNHNDAQVKAAKAKGTALSGDDLLEYHNLKATANLKATSERELLYSLEHELKTKKDILVSTQDSLDVSQRKFEKIRADEKSLLERKVTIEGKAKVCRDELARVRKDHGDLQARRVQTSQTEQELNEKLADCLTKLQEAGVDKRDTEREVKFRETLATLKRTFPGVKGRVIDLCKPTLAKYGLAVTTILGRNIDSVVVDNEKTAIACIEYMRVQRAGQATFIPLETIQAKAVNDKYRSYARGARLAIDVITYDASVERAMQHACGNALVCDSMEIAKHVCYDKGQEVKAVTLEGTIIHRSGLITGGQSSGQGRQFEEHDVENLRRRQQELIGKLQEIQKNKPRPNVENGLLSEISRLESEMTNIKDDLTASTSRLNGIQAELKTLKKSITDLTNKVNQATTEIDAMEKKAAGYRVIVDKAEVTIYSAFCKRIRVSSIREYEEKQLAGAQADNESRLKYDTQIARLTNRREFAIETVQNIQDRLDTLMTTAKVERGSLARLQAEKEAAIAQLEEVEAEIESLRETLIELQDVLTEKTAALEETRKAGGKTGKVLDKLLKEIGGCNDEIEKLASNRFAVYRRCKLEEIDLPMEKGSLDDIPIDEALPEAMAMDVDGEEDGTQRAATVANFGVVVNFEDLDSDEEEDGSDAMDIMLASAITNIETEMEKMSPNMKAIERLGDSEARFREIDGEFEGARQTAKEAKDAFTKVKKERCDLFNKAFNHISDRIDEVYKDLTKGKASPMGGVAYLSLEDSEEPYLNGIKYHAMPPMKRFRDMDQLSGGEKTMAALALLFAIHSYHPSPFFVLDEVDAALDNTNVSRIASYVKRLANPDFQFVVISLKAALYEQASALVGVLRDGGSKSLTLDLDAYAV